MKKLSIMVMMLLGAFVTFSQSFEGTIKWSMKMDITDPATKAKMEEAQKKMSDPANQAKMKEMQAKMNDPQMKAMLDANPQMKTQMETAMKMMAGGDMNSMMPKGMTIKVKNNNSLTKMDGGIMDKMEILYLKDKNESVRIDHAAKSYSILPSGSGENKTTQPEATVTKTSETMKILNHTCTKYTVDVKEPNGKTAQQIFWTTKEIDIDLKNLANQKAGRSQFFYKDIEGVPLRTEMVMPEGKMTMEATEIKKESLPASSFQIPAGYVKK